MSLLISNVMKMLLVCQTCVDNLWCGSISVPRCPAVGGGREDPPLFIFCFVCFSCVIVFVCSCFLF